MKKIVIPRKRTGTGTILDLESEMFDIEIKLEEGQYAVVYPAYYGAEPVILPDAKSAYDFVVREGADGYNGVRAIDASGEVFFDAGGINLCPFEKRYKAEVV